MVNDGGPAFARPATIVNPAQDAIVECHQTGMSLRDYFAAAALQGLIAEPAVDGYDSAGQSALKRPCEDEDDFCAYMAEAAYRFADAMLDARAPREK
jgi:hypothetical protein